MNSNTTLVKVKLNKLNDNQYTVYNSNTTLVKVKFCRRLIKLIIFYIQIQHLLKLNMEN